MEREYINEKTTAKGEMEENQFIKSQTTIRFLSSQFEINKAKITITRPKYERNRFVNENRQCELCSRCFPIGLCAPKSQLQLWGMSSA